MEEYSMAQVELLTGISAHKLRMWERRYTFLKPMRSPTNIRFYSDQQLKKLINVGILNRNGFRISKIDKMSTLEVFENVTEILSNISEENSDEINALVLYMFELNEVAFNKVFQRSIMRKGFLSTITEIIYPFLNQIGILWSNNKLMIAQEHFISNLVRQKIISAIETLPSPQENAPSIVFFLEKNEDHELGLLLGSFIAKDLGWKVFYLGQRVPYENIKTVVEMVEPALLMTLITSPLKDSQIKTFSNFFNTIDIPLLLSGNVQQLEENVLLKNKIIIPNPDALTQYLNDFRKN